MFESIFTDGTATAIGVVIALSVALVCGIIFALLSRYKSNSSASFFIAVALLPMTVAMVIALVNGNLGVGVAIAGAFGLVRFRSATGSAREIAVIFITMASGLAFGMGYIAFGALFLLVCGILLILAGKVALSFNNKQSRVKLVKITIPESLDYTEVFDDAFRNFAENHELLKVKTVNMGSMFRLSYKVTLKDSSCEKPLLDSIRERNGNLEIQCSRIDLTESEL